MISWQGAVSMLGAAALTLLLCLSLPLLDATRHTDFRLEPAPVAVVVLPRPKQEPPDRTVRPGPSGAARANSDAPALPRTPFLPMSLPDTADTGLPALPGPPSLDFAVPAPPEHGLGGTGTPDFDTPPQVLTRLDPFYPAAARRSGTEGQVTLRVLVDDRGYVTETSVVRSEPAGVFDAAAVKAVRGWRFSPAKRLGKPVPVRIDIPILFRLDK